MELIDVLLANCPAGVNAAAQLLLTSFKLFSRIHRLDIKRKDE